jgi:hypothetical protein
MLTYESVISLSLAAGASLHLDKLPVLREIFGVRSTLVLPHADTLYCTPAGTASTLTTTNIARGFSCLLNPLHGGVLKCSSGTQFTCFTGTKVQILTPEALRGMDTYPNIPNERHCACVRPCQNARFRGSAAILPPGRFIQ